jgi:hypothetical protein
MGEKIPVSTNDIAAKVLSCFGLSQQDNISSLIVNFEAGQLVTLKITKLVTDDEINEFYEVINKYNLVDKDADS